MEAVFFCLQLQIATVFLMCFFHMCWIFLEVWKAGFPCTKQTIGKFQRDWGCRWWPDASSLWSTFFWWFWIAMACPVLFLKHKNWWGFLHLKAKTGCVFCCSFLGRKMIYIYPKSGAVCFFLSELLLCLLCFPDKDHTLKHLGSVAVWISRVWS